MCVNPEPFVRDVRGNLICEHVEGVSHTCGSAGVTVTTRAPINTTVDETEKTSGRVVK